MNIVVHILLLSLLTFTFGFIARSIFNHFLIIMLAIVLQSTIYVYYVVGGWIGIIPFTISLITGLIGVIIKSLRIRMDQEKLTIQS